MEVSSKDTASFPIGLVIFIFVCCVFFGYVYALLFKKKQSKDKEPVASNHEKAAPSKNTAAVKLATTGKINNKKVFRAPKQHQFSSPDLAFTFKGPKEFVTSSAVSANSKGLIMAALDRTVFTYNLREAFSGNGPSGVQGTRTNIQYDHVDKLSWSPDYTAILVHKANAQTLEVLKGTKKTDGTLANFNKVREFTKPFPDPLVGLSVAGNGKFIMTCVGSTNMLCFWDLHGEQLASMDTKQGHTLHAAISIDDRFVATSGFTPEVKVCEVIYDKSDNFKGIKKAFELTGHSSRIFGSHFSPDSSKMATVAKDGTWKLYDTNVDYKQGQSPTVLVSGIVAGARDIEDSEPCVVKLSPDTRVVLVTVGNTFYCYSASSGTLVHKVEAIYAGPIIEVFFDAGNQFLVTVGDNQAHLFHNVAGHHATIQDLEVSLKAANYSAMKDRIRNQLEAAKKALQKLEDKTANNKKTKQEQNNKKNEVANGDDSKKKK